MPQLSKVTREAVDKWTGEIEIANEVKKTRMHQRWRRTLDNWRNLYQTGARIDEHSTFANVVHALAGVIIPSIYYRDPTLLPVPQIPGIDEQAELTAALLNYYMRVQNFKRQAKRVALDSFLFGEGHFKIGWELEVERALTPMFDDDGTPLLAGGLPLHIDVDGIVYREEGGLFRAFLDKDQNFIPENHPTLNERILREQPSAIRWSPWDFLKDPKSVLPDHTDSEWVAFRSYPHIDEVKNHPFYENTSKLEPTHIPDYIREIRDQRPKRISDDAMTDRVQLYELYYKEYDKAINSWRTNLIVLAEGHDAPLFHDFSPLKIKGFPVESVVFIEDPERSESVSMIDVIRPQIDNLNVALSQLSNLRERNNQKYLYNKNAGISEGDARRFAAGRIADVLGVRVDPSMDVKRAFQVPEMLPVDQAVIQEIQLAWDTIQRISGINEHHLGGAGVARQATQASFIESALGVRLQEKADILADGILGVMRKWKDLLIQYGDFAVALKINRAGEDTWAEFKVSDTVPEALDFTFDIHTSAFQSRTQEKNETLQLLNIVAAIPNVNLLPILERLFRAYGFPTIENMFLPTQPQANPGEEGQSLSERAIDTNSANAFLNPGLTAENTGSQGGSV